MTRSRTVWVTAALMATTLGAATVPAMAVAAPATQAAAACPAGWGSIGETNSASTAGHYVTNARTGRHDCYDRFVIDVPGAPADQLGYSVRYVDRLIQDPTGHRIPVSGGAILEVIVRAPAYDIDSGTPTYPGRAGKPLPGVNLTGYRTFRDAKFAGTFEGQSQFGLGLRARLPFRVLQQAGHLVVDVAHMW
ncbi:AMIN-like domain-containing (lipo)protein [Streptomyces sp. NPDC003015]